MSEQQLLTNGDAPAVEGNADFPAPEPAATAERRKRGAPYGNVNAVQHGQRTSRNVFVLGKLGRRYRAIWHEARMLRRAIEAELTAGGRTLTLQQRARVQTLCRLELSIRSLELNIRDDPDIEPEAIQRNRAAITQYSLARDRVLVELLGGDAAGDRWPTATDVWNQELGGSGNDHRNQ